MIYDSREESFFIIDTETMGIDDNSIIMDISLVFVDMARLFKEHEKVNNFSPVSFDNFKRLPFVKKFTIHPSIREQKELGGNIDKGTLKFWKDQKDTAKRNEYKDYIKKLFTESNISIEETVNGVEEFINECIKSKGPNRQDCNNLPFLERSGGFDTNKYYNLVSKVREREKTLLRFWNRREIRTLISCNKWRLPEVYLQRESTKWSIDFFGQMMEDKNSFVPHIAIHDCLLEAYTIYFCKMTVDNFYI